MKMEFVDEAELQKAAEEPEDEVRGVKAVLSAAALTVRNITWRWDFPALTMKRCTARASATTRWANAF